MLLLIMIIKALLLFLVLLLWCFVSSTFLIYFSLVFSTIEFKSVC